jgi:RNA recognition motif-containing protein
VERKFEQYGPVIEARIVRDPNTGASKGFGFVELERERDRDEVRRLAGGAGRRAGGGLGGRRVLLLELAGCAGCAGCARARECAVLGALATSPALAHRRHRPATATATAPQAIRDLDQREWDGRRLKVEKARNPMV